MVWEFSSRSDFFSTHTNSSSSNICSAVYKNKEILAKEAVKSEPRLYHFELSDGYDTYYTFKSPGQNN